MKIAILMCLSAAALPAQTTVEGRVIDSVTGQPIAGAYVIGPRFSSARPTPATDASGHFRVPYEGKGTVIQARAGGYLEQTHPIFDANNVQVFLTPASVLLGKIEDEDGVPVAHAQVQALHYADSFGIRKLTSASEAFTNEKGEYRLVNLSAGSYYLRVAPDKLTAWDARYSPRLYPSTVDLSHAQTIELKTGEQRGLPVMRLTREDGVTVSGRIESPPPNRHNVTIESGDPFGFSANTLILPNGTFQFTHVIPGTYTLKTTMQHERPSAGVPFASTTLEVANTDVAGIVLTAKPFTPINIPGKVTFRGAQPQKTKIELLNPILFNAQADVAADGTFVLHGLFPGHYDLRMDGTNQAVSALLGDREVLFTGVNLAAETPGSLNITVGAPIAQVTGKLSDDSGQPLAHALVNLTAAAGLRLSGATDATGVFKVDVLTPGDYRISVRPTLTHTIPNDWPDLALDQPPVHIVAGTMLTLNLRLPPQ